MRQPPRSALFPYTSLFGSRGEGPGHQRRVGHAEGAGAGAGLAQVVRDYDAKSLAAELLGVGIGQLHVEAVAAGHDLAENGRADGWSQVTTVSQMEHSAIVA